MKIVVQHDDGTEIDVTERVKAVWNAYWNAMDDEGYLYRDDTGVEIGLVKRFGDLCGWEDPDAAFQAERMKKP